MIEACTKKVYGLNGNSSLPPVIFTDAALVS